MVVVPWYWYCCFGTDTMVLLLWCYCFGTDAMVLMTMILLTK